MSTLITNNIQSHNTGADPFDIQASALTLNGNPIAGGGGTERDFIFDPNATPSGNVYDDLSALLTAGSSINGKKNIYVTNSVSPGSPIVIAGGGTFDFTDYSVFALNLGELPAGIALNFSAETTITEFFDQYGLPLVFNNTVAPVCSYTFGSTSYRGSVSVVGGKITNLGSQPVFSLGAFTGFILQINDYNSAPSLVTTGYEIFELTSASSALLIRQLSKIGDFFMSGTNLVRGTVGSYVLDLASGNYYGGTNANFSGTSSVTEYGYNLIEAPPTAVTGSGTVNVNMKKRSFTVAPSGNITLNLQTPVSGRSYLFEIQQGVTPYTVGFTQTIKWREGTPFVATVSANARDIVSLYYNGTDYYGTFGLAYA